MSLRFRKVRTNFRRLLIIALLLFGAPNLYSVAAGGALVLIGQTIHLISAGYLIKREQLITAGPYKYVRNPFYVGSFLTDCGFCLMAFNPFVALAWFPMFYYIVIFGRVVVEEKYLLERFGIEFAEYCRKVPQFLPRLTPAFKEGNGEFLYATLARNREVSRVFKSVALIPMFYLLMNFRADLAKHIGGFSRIFTEVLPAFMSRPANIAVVAAVLVLLTVPPMIFTKKAAEECD